MKVRENQVFFVLSFMPFLPFMVKFLLSDEY